MIVYFVLLILIAGVLSLPAWWVSKERGGQTIWLLFLSAPAMVLWIVLTAAGVGAQSLSNLVEAIGIAGFGVVAAYFHVFFLDQLTGKAKAGIPVLMAALAGLAIALRLFMPLLPE